MRWMEVKNNSSANWELNQQRPKGGRGPQGLVGAQKFMHLEHLRASSMAPWMICCLFSRIPGKLCSQMAVWLPSAGTQICPRATLRCDLVG